MGPFCPLMKLVLRDCRRRFSTKKKRNLWIFFKALKHNMCIFCPMNTDRKKLVKEESTHMLWLHFRLNSFFKVKLVYTSAAVFIITFNEGHPHLLTPEFRYMYVKKN